ncbi:MAG: response regulator [Polyangiaceae bacterium]|nr:response regulator [Polyangiaceae bacterium]
MATPARILAIDDEVGMRVGIERALRQFVITVPALDETISLEVETAATAEEGLSRIDSFRPDLLLLDHKLPGMSGLELLEVLSRRGEELDLLTIVITAYASIDTAIKATKQGAYDFLAKPFTPLELKAAVRNAISHLIVRRRARALAEERRQVRFQFISVLAHELKAPLGAVEGFLMLLSEPGAVEDPDKRKHLMDRSLVRLRGMRKLIYDLLDLTRIESGTMKRELSDVDLVDVARTVVETMAPDAKQNGVDIRLECPERLVMLSDRSEFEIMFNNLVSNAVKYNRQDGTVTVRMRDLDDRVIVEVEDTGIGMTEKESQRLFSDFVRIKNAKTASILGSGLGLSIVKKLADLYDGSVSVRSEPDVGSTFRVELRRSPAPSRDAGGTPGLGELIGGVSRSETSLARVVR